MPFKRFKLGPGGVMYTVVAVLILMVAIYTQANLLFWGFGLMIGGLLVSVTHSYAMLRGLEVQRVLPNHGVAGEPLALRYRVANRKGWTPVFGLVINETWGRGARGYRKTGPVSPAAAPDETRLRAQPFGWVLHLGPNQTLQAEARCWPTRRGVLRFERIVLSSSFPFGVVRRIVEYERPGHVLIYPHLWRMDRHVLHRLARIDPAGSRRRERGGGSEEFFGLRPYRPGDSVRTIDWKRSAKTGELVCREMTHPTPPQVMVALDLTLAPVAHALDAAPRAEPGAQGPEDPVEAAVSLTASLVCDAHFRGCQVGLAVLGVPCQAFPIHHSLPHRTRMLEALARLDTSRRTGEAAVLSASPTVIVRPGPGGGNGQSNVMYAGQLARYVSGSGERASALLRRGMAPARERRLRRRSRPWD